MEAVAVAVCTQPQEVLQAAQRHVKAKMAEPDRQAAQVPVAAAVVLVRLVCREVVAERHRALVAMESHGLTA